MKFGIVGLGAAEDAILAHTVRWPGGALRKGARLDAAKIRMLRRAGVVEVMAARREPGDIDEDSVATRIARALAPDPEGQGLAVGRAATGRVNLHAREPGILRVREEAVAALNNVDEAITLATLPDYGRVAARRMAATVKVIPYAVPERVVSRACEAVGDGEPVIRVAPIVLRSAALVLTRLPWTPDRLAAKGEEAVRRRLESYGVPLVDVAAPPHAVTAVADALGEVDAELALILGDSVTSDRNDVIPTAIRKAGGEVVRFGMPVDPGNLLLLGRIGKRRVVVLPGCARSPKLNGADWILDRIVCGIDVDAEEVARMGVGGLLHEIPLRPAPRVGGAERARKPRYSLLLLAAGASRRLGGGRHKLLEDAEGRPLAARAAANLAGARVRELLAVVGSRAPEVAAAIRDGGGEAVRIVRNPAWEEGIGASIRAGMAAIAPDADGVIIAFADMPEIDSATVDRLIDAHDPGAGSGICRIVGPDGEPGHPLLFGRRYFEALSALVGDRGARDVVLENQDDVVDLAVGRRAIMDLDTEDDWSRWRAAQAPNGPGKP